MHLIGVAAHEDRTCSVVKVPVVVQKGGSSILSKLQ